MIRTNQSLFMVGLVVLVAVAGPSPLLAQERAVGGPYTVNGPGPGTAAQNSTLSGADSICGALETVVAHPTNNLIAYVGSVNGGIFRTGDATTVPPSWTALTDAQSSLSISSLDIDLTAGPAFATLVAGVGRTSAYARIGGAQTGLLYTTNSGSTWAPIGTTGSPNLVNKNVRAVIARGATILAAVDGNSDGGFADGGIYRSVDTGASFTKISGGVGTGLPTGTTFDLVGNPAMTAGVPLLPNQLYTTVTDNGTAASNGIYRSDDGGATWAKISNAAMDTLLQGNPDNVEIAVGQQSTVGNPNVFVAICSSGGQLNGLYYTADASVVAPTWQALTLPTTQEPAGFPVGIHPGSQCVFHLSLVADPVDHDACYIGGDRQPHANEGSGGSAAFPNSIGSTTYYGRLFRVDAVTGVVPLTDSGTNGGTAPHADSREMAFDAGGEIIEVDDGGVYRRTSPTTTTGDWNDMCGGLSAAEQHDVEYDSNSPTLGAGYAGSGNQDNGVTVQNTSGGLPWTSQFLGDGGDIESADGDGEWFGGGCAGNGGTPPCSSRYSSSQFLGSFGALIYDTNNTYLGYVFRSLTPSGPSAGSSFFVQFRTPFEVNAADPTRIIFGGGSNTMGAPTQDSVWESSDRGNTIVQVPSTMHVINSFYENPIAYGIPGNADILYYGTGADVYVRTTGALTAPTQASTYPGANLVRDIVIDPSDPNHAFVVDQSAVYETPDAGATWNTVTGNLFSGFSPGSVRAVTYVESGTGDGVVVGTDRGVYRATEGSAFANWDQLGTGLPNALVFDLDYDAADDKLVVGTMGRGTWVLTGVQATVPVDLQWFQVQ